MAKAKKKETKPGYKTTEFWVTLATGLWAAVGPAVPPEYQVIIPAVGSALYTVARSVAKAKGKE